MDQLNSYGCTNTAARADLNKFAVCRQHPIPIRPLHTLHTYQAITISSLHRDLHIESLLIRVLVHVAIHEFLHLDGVDLAATGDLGEALVHDLLVAAPGNLFPAVEGVQDRLDLPYDALLPLERVFLFMVDWTPAWTSL